MADMSGASEDLRTQMINELGDVVRAIDETATAHLIDEVVRSRSLFTYGVGREGLVLQSFCMRLYHLGLDAHVVGDMTTPSVHSGDLFITSAGPGYFSTVGALMDVVRRSGGRTALVTANPDAELPRRADLVIVIPGRTMAGGMGEKASIQPMGSLYEQAMWVYFDYVVLKMIRRFSTSFEEMSRRHTNLE
jgi:6-phospho-3-hexuloisomerase